ncbi:hypothetical protein BGZ63DRAFT_438495, partial [Mariannaea sp. PMI_226]
MEIKLVSMGQQFTEPRLSTRMRDSDARLVEVWSLLVRLCSQEKFQLDAIYWAVIHDGGTGIERLDDEARAEMKPFIDKNKEQLRAYKQECTVCFS